MKTQLLTATCAVALCAYATAAAAQSPAPTSDQGTAVAEVIVTAQRRSESLQKVPVSVTVVTADTLAKQNVNSLQQLSIAAPSLQMGQENTYSIRGVGTLAFQQTVDPAVAVAVDDVNLARISLSEGVLNDVAQIEVLNGPQGLLFGRNASAGLLNITTTRPQLGVMSGHADVEYDLRDTTPGNGRGYIARSALNVPLGEVAAARVSLAYESQDPVTQALQSGPGSDLRRRALDTRYKLLLEPSDNLSIYAIASYASVKGTAGLFDRTYRSLAPGSANIAPLQADGFVASPDLLQYRADGTNFRKLTNGGAQLNATYTFANDWALTNVAAYKGYNLRQAIDLDFTSSNADSALAGRSNYDQFSEELRLTLPQDARLSGQFGLFFMTFQDRAVSTNAGNLYVPSFVLPNPPFCVRAAPGGGCSVANNYAVGADSIYELNSDSYAAFSQLTYALTDQLRLIGGLRVTHDKVSIDLTQNQLSYFVRFGGPRGHFAESADNTDVSWKFGAQYQATPDILFYASAAKGYKGPGMNATSATATSPLVVRPETSRNIELGAKTSWLERRLTANLALFHTNYRDYQASGFDPVLSAFVVRNAARLTSKGAELSVVARPTRNFTLNGSASLLDSKFKDFPGAQCYPGQGCSTFNAKSLRTPLAAKFSSTLVASQAIPLGDNLLTFSADWYHRSSINFLANGNPLTRIGAVDLLGARASFELGRNVRLSVFCKNCTDERVPSFIGNDPGDANARPAPLNSTYQAYGFNAVRTIGASLGVDF